MLWVTSVAQELSVSDGDSNICFLKKEIESPDGLVGVFLCPFATIADSPKSTTFMPSIETDVGAQEEDHDRH